MADPWEDAAKEYKAAGGKTTPAVTTPSSGNDDWKVWQASGSGGGSSGSLWDKALDAGWRGLGAFGESINPMPIARALVHPINTATGMFNATTDAVGRTREALGRGDYGEAAKSAVGAVPVLGPGMEQITREATEGKIPEAVGHTTGLVFGPKIVKGVGGLLGKAAGPVMEGAVRLGQRPQGIPVGAVGRELLNQTSGASPKVIARTGNVALRDLAAETQAGAAAGGRGSLTPARDIANQTIQRAGQFTDKTVRAIEPMQEFLNEPGPTFGGTQLQRPAPMVPVQSKILGSSGQPVVTYQPGSPPPPVIAPTQSASDLLAARQRFDEAFLSNPKWRQEYPGEPTQTARNIYGALTGELHRVAPDTRAPDLSQRLLIPGVKAAERTARGGGFGPGMLGQILRPGMAVLANPSIMAGTARGLDYLGRGLQTPWGSQPIRLSPFLARADVNQ